MFGWLFRKLKEAYVPDATLNSQTNEMKSSNLKQEPKCAADSQETHAEDLPQEMVDDLSAKFDEDMRKLHARSDLTSASEIFDAEVKHAMELMEKAESPENITEGLYLLNRMASQFEYTPAMYWLGDISEHIFKNMEAACRWYKMAADKGHGPSARCYADMLMAGIGVHQDPQTAFDYYVIAAKHGIPEAAFVLGEFYRSSNHREDAMEAYRHAAEGGFDMANERIQQMESGEI